DAPDPASADFRLSTKPRGALCNSHVSRFDRETTSGASPVMAFRINKDGSFGRWKDSDVLEPDEFQALVDFCHHKIAELAGQMVSGQIEVRPYLYRDTTPCVRCDYRAICRFEPSINRYRKLEPMQRQEAIEKMRKEMS